MRDFSKYDYKLKDYEELFPDYLQSPGSYTMHLTRLKYDLMNNFKNVIIDFWSKLDSNNLEEDYIIWRRNNPDLDENLWPYAEMTSNICKTYGIRREHEVGLLTFKHMLRLLKVKKAGVGFDGTRESLNNLLKELLPGITFVASTLTSLKGDPSVGHVPATADVHLIRPENDSTFFDDIDERLFEGGFYFLNILGINFRFEIRDSTDLLYDYTKYADDPSDPETRYDKGGN